MVNQNNIIENYSQLGIEKGAKLAIAVSGGADSLALLYLSYRHFDVTVLTVDHGLRKEARDEACYVASLCERLGVPHTILTWEGDKPEGNIQAEAREARYALMETWCRRHGYPFLAVAHHKDDQAETFLLRLARGSGVYGLSGMKASRQLDNGVKLIRPLLNYAKAELVEYLNEQKIEWIEDPSNQSEKYGRAKARAMLEKPPLDGLNTDRLVDTVHRMQQAQDALSFYEGQWLRAALSERFGFAFLDLKALDTAPDEIVLRGLSRVCMFIGGQIYGPRYERLCRLKIELGSSDFNGATLSGAQFVPQKDGKILICREQRQIETIKPLLPEGNWDNRFSFTAKGDIAGLTIGKLGEAGLRFLKENHLGFDQVSVPRQALLAWPAVYRGDNLRLVPELGYDDLENADIRISLKRNILDKK
ncbi:tRNA lysidine(34) synthetase TilS [Kordiimonas sp. SCSIO 12603]|uniref:tRNA lysidine(34) synthetase TilS n=1 Tax=Kordiimonas sp. SCSIO 12603 TaxID=2829596 RepID=UPI002105F93C|nr:tRNA lysidine(34) synthetase TilS [Kordiimonas sp. SCSIO 12603]UTW57980.1 tRNA lysidine(34) synthetase TilS [Kordiimonas sp. SCSIO 12603]